MLLALFLINFAQGEYEGCDGIGHFVMDPSTYSCRYYCFHSNKYINLTELSFDYMKDQYPHIYIASTKYPDDCNSVDDLTYIHHPCIPYCKCPRENKQGYIKSIETIRSFAQRKKTCYNCTCVSESELGSDELIYKCHQLIDTVYLWDYQWNTYQCPPHNRYCIDESGSSRSIGEQWWYSLGSIINGSYNHFYRCNTLCYCSSNGTVTCETGWNNILKNKVLYQRFESRCFSNICMDDASRRLLYNQSNGSSCDSCPVCSCGNYSLGDTWYIETGDELTKTCNKCECKFETSGMRNYPYCISVGTYPAGELTCPITNAKNIRCHQSDCSTWPVGGVFSVECEHYYFGNISFCSWLSFNNEGSTGSHFDRTSNGTVWGCADSYDFYRTSEGTTSNVAFCEAFGNNECIYYHQYQMFPNCYGDPIGESTTQYAYCCATDNCNYLNVNKSKCTHNKIVEDAINKRLKCVYNVETEFNCNDNGKYDCEFFERIYTDYAGCICAEYADMYVSVSNATKQNLQYIFNSWFKMVIEASMPDVLGCNIEYTDLECDFFSGVIKNTGNGRATNIMTIVWITVAVMLCLLASVLIYVVHCNSEKKIEFTICKL